MSLATRAALREVIEGDGPTARAAVERLKPYWWVADFDPLRRACNREQVRGRWERLAQAYRDLTGRDVQFGADRLIEYGGPERLFVD